MTKIALGQVIQINPSSIRSDFHYDEIEYLDISSVGTGSYSGTKTLQTVSAPSRAKRLVQNKDTILATVRPNLRSFALIKNPPANLVVSTGFAVLHSTELIDPIFLYYSVTDQTFTDYLASNVKGAAYPAVDTEIIARGEIFYPPLDVQRKIAAVLSAYDDLIEVNTRRIRILEQMARAIYHEWFGKVDTKSLPVGWEMLKVGDLIYFAKGKKPKTTSTTGNIPLLLIESLRTGATEFTEDPAMLIAETDDIIMVMDGASSGSIYTGNYGAVGSTLGRYRPVDRQRLSHYHFYFFILENLQQISDNNIGAAIPHANKDFINQLEIPIPPRVIENQFHQQMVPIFDLIQVLRKKNANLRRTRDLLLPRLVSGEVDVNEMGIAI